MSVPRTTKDILQFPIYLKMRIPLSIAIFFLFLFSSPFAQLASAQMNGSMYEYRLKYSDGINAIQNQSFAKAAIIAKQLIELQREKPEGYLLMGNVHFHEKLYLQADSNYLKAYSYRSGFIFKADRLTLYEQMAATYAKMKNEPRQLEILEESTKWFSKKKTALLKLRIGRAFFSLALLQRQRQNWVAAKLHLIEAAQHGYLPKTSYLILAHYYATTPKEQLADNNLAFYRREVKTEDRATSFNFFYKLYKNHPESFQEESYLMKDEIKRVLEEVSLYQDALRGPNTVFLKALKLFSDSTPPYQTANQTSLKSSEINPLSSSLQNSFDSTSSSEILPITPLPPTPK